jgi:hypothetical protein
MITIRRTCPKCGDDMVVELLRPDPHDTPVLFLVCPCGYWEAAPADIEAELERPSPDAGILRRWKK